MFNDQIRAVVERFAIVGLTYLASHGFITTADVQAFATAIVALIAAGLAWHRNRPAKLVERAERVADKVLPK